MTKSKEAQLRSALLRHRARSLVEAKLLAELQHRTFVKAFLGEGHSLHDEEALNRVRASARIAVRQVWETEDQIRRLVRK